MFKLHADKRVCLSHLSRSKLGFWTRLFLRSSGLLTNPYKIDSHGGTRWQRYTEDHSCRA